MASAKKDEPHPLTSRVKFRLSNRDFRARAHSNPLNDGNFDVPSRPSEVEWRKWFDLESATSEGLRARALKEEVDVTRPEWVDIGCGYGGLLAEMSTAFPDKLMVGLEIRDRPLQFCEERIKKLRKEAPGSYGNVWYIRTNVMKFLVNFFEKGSVEKMFFCYPDPHYKKKKHRQRIVSMQLLAEYAYVLSPSALVYVVTDVEELFQWISERLTKHPLFTQLTDEEIVSKFQDKLSSQQHSFAVAKITIQSLSIL
ncbi:hypothetical protein NDN08_005388 [Rhodosorus marinus]|uniref:tRNA (guanine-N(7)-)-methyltransferase n=1 Tax=Rhodosorus marinus TaxID=101924 RepID=A0AAV8V3R8_9RHOD|nr:hypothetical protein NDN08_005388 [Rhodosorus marinus]